MNKPQRFSIMVHGGAGAVREVEGYQAGMRRALEAGAAVLAADGPALDAVEAAVMVLEDDPLFNAGRGSVLNERGEVELDASIMEGAAMRAGAVAAVRGIKNPVTLARAVMEKSQHVLLMGEGAQEFARLHGIAAEPADYFITPFRVEQLRQAKESEVVVLDHSSLGDEKKFGTVGAVARDRHGNLAAATSTGGLVNKKFGRVGDTPIVGAGVYAENETCAVSATGYGEQFIRTVLSKTIADIIRHSGVGAQEAAQQGIGYLVSKVRGLGGVIVIDRHGTPAAAYSTPGLAHGILVEGEEPQCLFR